MDFILKNPVISKFLQQFPKQDWNDVLISAILSGIPHVPVVSQTRSVSDPSSLPYLRQQLTSMKEELEKLNQSLEAPKTSIKSMNKSSSREKEIKIPKTSNVKVEETPRFQKQSPHKSSVSPIRTKDPSKNVSPVRYKSTSQWRTTKPPPKPRAIPKYLQNVDSKIRCDVQKDIANYKSLIESNPEDSIEKNSLSLIDLSDKNPTKGSRAGFFDSSESKSNSFSMNSEVRLTNTLEGTFTNQEIAYRSQPAQEIPVDRDFETPRYPTEYLKENPESEILEIAENFLSGQLMAELCSSMDSNSERNKCAKSQQVPPLDLLTSQESITPFRQRWEEATKDIGKKWEIENQTRDYRKNTTSREFFSGRSSTTMMVQTPSPIPYDNKLGPMFQDASYSKYF